MENPRSDQHLLQAFTKSGDRKAFRELVDRYSGLIYHTALRIWNDRTLAENVSQRVFGALAAKSTNVLRDSVPLSTSLAARHHSEKLPPKSLP